MMLYASNKELSKIKMTLPYIGEPNQRFTGTGDLLMAMLLVQLNKCDAGIYGLGVQRAVNIVRGVLK